MPIFYPDLKIAANWNNAAGLAAWESITPSSDRAFFAPRIFGTYDPGSRRIGTDGLDTFAGYGSVDLLWEAITKLQERYLRETYCSNGYNGKVTVRLRTDDPDTYANYNAILKLPKLNESANRFNAWQNYRARLIKLVAL